MLAWLKRFRTMAPQTEDVASSARQRESDEMSNILAQVSRFRKEVRKFSSTASALHQLAHK